MPIDQLDPRTLLLGLQPQARTPYDAQDLVAERRARVEQLREQAKAKQEAEYDNQLYDWAIKSNLGPDGTPDIDGVRKSLYSVAPRTALKFDDVVTKAKKAVYDEKEAGLKARKAGLEIYGNVVRGATADNWHVTLPILRQLDPALSAQLSDEFNPDQLDAANKMQLTADQVVTQQREALKYYADNKPLLGAAQQIAALPADPTDSDVAGIVKNWNDHGGKTSDLKPMLDLPTEQLKPWADNLLKGPKTIAELQGQAETRAETKRRDDLMEADRQAGAKRADLAAGALDAYRKARLAQGANRGAAAAGGTATAPSPIDPNAPHGADFLSTIPKDAAMVKALAEGKQPWPAAQALRMPYWQDLVQKVFQYDPTFDTAQASNNARLKTRQDFTSGKSANTINALNTVAGHLAHLAEIGDQLGNTDSEFVNYVRNAITPSGTVRGVSINNFNIAKQAVADELTRAYRGAGGSEADIKGWQSSINDAKSPAALKGAWQTIGHLLGSKLDAMQTQADQGLGIGALQVINPEGRQSLNRLTGEKTGHYVGEKVRLASGKTVTITAVHPDGSWDGQ